VSDKELHVISFQLLLSVLEYQTAVMRRDFETADKVLPTIPKEQRTRVAHFLEKQGFKQQALAVSNDLDHKFELAIQIGNLKVAYQLASEIDSDQKWTQLADLATESGNLEMAQECLHKAHNFGGLLLLATTMGNGEMIGKLASSSLASGKNNVAFLSLFIRGDLEQCLDLLISTNRLPEAAFFARSYMPSKLPQVLMMWKDHVATFSEKASKSLANPEEYKNLFPNYDRSLLDEAERNGSAADNSSNCPSVRQEEPKSDGHSYVNNEEMPGPSASEELDDGDLVDELNDLKLDNIDTTDINLDDEELLKD